MFWFLGLMSVSILERVLGSVYVTDYGVNPLTREGQRMMSLSVHRQSSWELEGVPVALRPSSGPDSNPNLQTGNGCLLVCLDLGLIRSIGTDTGGHSYCRMADVNLRREEVRLTLLSRTRSYKLMELPTE